MDELKKIISANISTLRKNAQMTQAELAEKLNYTDKAVSKWERGESIPDISVLLDISKIFDVSVDYLLKQEHEEASAENDASAAAEATAENDSQIPATHRLSNHTYITGISIILVWLIATFVFVMIDMIIPSLSYHWLAFIYAVPTSMIVWLVFNSIWFNRRRNFLIISLLMWTTLASIQLTLLPAGANIMQIFGLGVPGQVIILLWSRIRGKRKK